MISIALLGMLIQAQEPNTPPPTMTRMDVRIVGTDIRSGSYAALPKLIYRAGAKYARMENAPDAKARIEKVTIIAEPDAYSVDLIDHSGTHAIDQGGPNDLHLPMVLPLDPKHRMGMLDRLEFGDELEFFEKAGAVKSAGPLVNGKPTDLYSVNSGDGSATLTTRTGSDRPIFMAWKNRDGSYRYEYSSYEEVPFDANLFRKPNGVKFREIPPPTEEELKQ